MNFRSVENGTTPGSVAKPELVSAATLPLTDTLAVRLMRIVFGCYFVVAMAVTGAQLVFEYKATEYRLMQEIAAMQRTFSPGITDAMWRFNAAVLRGILTGMKEMPVVVGLKVEDEHGAWVQGLGMIQLGDGALAMVDAEGRARPLPDRQAFFSHVFSQTFDVIHTEVDGSRQLIGRWTVYSDRRIILAEVTNKFLFIFVNSVIKTLALWAILVFVIHRIVGRPLQQLSTFVGALNIDTLGGKPFVLNDRGRHELHLLTDMLNLMTGKLRHSVEENKRLMQDLQMINTTLQAKVVERTSELELLARTDLLTSLFNRRKLDEVLDYEATRVARYGGSLSVILVDIDHFKQVNDRYGHQVGDLVLASLAKTMLVGLRTVDTLGRWGGEEFMIICPETNLDAARLVAEQIRTKVEATELPEVGFKTCSLGVAQWLSTESVSAMVARADAALYRAKQRGRNRVETDPDVGSG